jgi:polysaccharide chain length determinant protein (PEP-CTERM system associated)
LLLQYTDKHPDVIALRETIAQLEERRSGEVAALKRGGGVLSAGAAASPVVQSIQLALNKADVEIAALRARISDHQRKVEELRKLVDTAPEVEAEFARLNRDYDVNRERYVAFVDRAERTKLGDEAEETDAVRFEVIDPPAAKFDPVAPNRALLLMAVLVVGLGAGCGIAFVLHQLRPVFTSSRALNEITGMPVLGVVSRTWLDKHRQQRRQELIRYSAAAAALLLVFACVMQFSDLGVRVAHKLVG